MSDMQGIDASTGHVVSTGEINSSINAGQWDKKKGYNPQQVLDILAHAGAKLQAAQEAAQKLIPELQGANTNDAALAVREVIYLVLFGSYALSSLVGDNDTTILSSSAASERMGSSVDYTAATDTALQAILGPQYAQYVGKTLPPISQQKAQTDQGQQQAAPLHVVVDNLKN